MKLRIEIELDNAAFEEPGEIERILTDLPTRLPESQPFSDIGEYSIHDVNGNWVGYARILRGTISESNRP